MIVAMELIEGAESRQKDLIQIDRNRLISKLTNHLLIVAMFHSIWLPLPEKTAFLVIVASYRQCVTYAGMPSSSNKNLT